MTRLMVFHVFAGQMMVGYLVVYPQAKRHVFFTRDHQLSTPFRIRKYKRLNLRRFS